MRIAPVKTFAFAVCVLLLGALGRAQSPCLSWSPEFGYPGGANDQVLASVVFDDGSGPALYIGGDFTILDGQPIEHIARWNGTSWSPVGPSIGGTVETLGLYDDGSGLALYAGGSFPGLLAKWTGSAWAAVGGGLSGVPPGFSTPDVRALAVYNDGSGPALFVTGLFLHAGSVASQSIAKWNGSSWAAVGLGLFGATPYGNALTVFDDGSGPALFVGGGFNFAGLHYVAKWQNGSWTPLGSGVGNTVWSLTTFDDGSGPALYAAGSFTTAGGSLASRIARWNGSSWSTLGTGLVYAAMPGSGPGTALIVHDDGSGPALYVGGRFDTAGGQPANNVARWNGVAWSTLAAGLNSQVLTLCEFDEGQGPELFAGGSFSGSGSLIAKGIERWDGTAWSMVGHRNGHGLDGPVYALKVYDDGAGPALYAGGDFQDAGGHAIRSIAKWNGSDWTALGGGFPATGNAVVRALEVYPAAGGPQLIVGGDGLPIAGSPAVARWTSSGWSGMGFGPPSGVSALATYNSGSGPKLYAGGYFPSVGGIASSSLGCWNGGFWQGVSSGLNGAVFALAVFDDGNGPKLYVGGTFNGAGSVSADFLATWNGTTFAPVSGALNGHVYSLTVHDDGSGPALYVGGYFTTAGSVPVNGIARWNGTSWSALGSGVSAASTPGVLALCSFDDGNGPALYAGGDFTIAGGATALSLARWDGTNWSPLGVGMNNTARSLAVFDDGSGSGGDLYAGGLFTSASVVDSLHLASWKRCGGAINRFCFGDGTVAPCPCGNYGLIRHGCENSAATGGARLGAGGTPSPDTITLSAAGELPSATSLFLQGDAVLGGSQPFGDGLRCVAGHVRRMYVKTASGGAASAPGQGDLSVTARAAALGDNITPGSVRVYQTWYRDPYAAFCPTPAGNLWNVTNGVRIVW